MEIVFLSACYSEGLAEAFKALGVKHIICISKDKKVLDQACIKFSEAFYEALFTEEVTPCKAFKIA